MAIYPRVQPASPGSPVRLGLLLAVLLGALVLPGCNSGPRGVAASEGIPNFARVTPALFRGAQPDERGLASLARLGVRTVINLRMPADTWPGEEAAARAQGLTYVNVPLPGLSAPTDAQVAQVLGLIATSPSPVFVHCEHGADRTGTIIASYRMQQDGWTAEQAFAEAKLYGFSALQFGMRHYILTRTPVRN